MVALSSFSELPQGTHETVFNAANYGSGVYFYRISVSDKADNKLLYTNTRKLLLIK